MVSVANRASELITFALAFATDLINKNPVFYDFSPFSFQRAVLAIPFRLVAFDLGTLTKYSNRIFLISAWNIAVHFPVLK